MIRLGLVMMLIGCGGGGEGDPDPDGSPPSDSPGAVTTDSKSIGPAGGTLTVDGAVLTVPANALPVALTLTLTKTTGALVGAYTQSSPVYELGPTGQTFAMPVSLAITYPAGTTPPSGVLMNWTAAGVQTPTGIADYEHLTPTISGNTVTASNDHFCTVGAAICPCEPDPGGGE